jgi:integrase/recombinase XerD
VHQAVWLMDNGMSKDEAAAVVSISSKELNSAMNKLKADRRADEVGVLRTDWERVTQASKNRLSVISTDEGFGAAANLTARAGLDADQVFDMVASLNQARSSSKQLEIIEQLNFVYSDRIQDVAGGKVSMTNRVRHRTPKAAVHMAIGNLVSLPADLTTISDRWVGDERTSAAKTTREASTRLIALATALAQEKPSSLAGIPTLARGCPANIDEASMERTHVVLRQRPFSPAQCHHRCSVTAVDSWLLRYGRAAVDMYRVSIEPTPRTGSDEPLSVAIALIGPTVDGPLLNTHYEPGDPPLDAAEVAPPEFDPDRGWRVSRELAERFLVEFRANTEVAYRGDLAKFFVFCQKIGMVPIMATRAQLGLYVKWMDTGGGLASTTVARRLSSLRGYYKLAVDEELIAKSPMAAMRKRRVTSSARRTGLSRDEFTTLLAFADADDTRSSLLVALGTLNGLRVSEIISLDAEDRGYDRGHKIIRVRRKGGDEVICPISDITAEIMDRHLARRTTGPMLRSLNNKRWTRTGANAVLKRLVRQALPHLAGTISMHSLRRTFITSSLDAGATLRDTQDAAGHADPKTTRDLYDLSRNSLDRHPTYLLSTWLAGDTPATRSPDPGPQRDANTCSEGA